MFVQSTNSSTGIWEEKEEEAKYLGNGEDASFFTLDRNNNGSAAGPYSSHSSPDMSMVRVESFKSLQPVLSDEGSYFQSSAIGVTCDNNHVDWLEDLDNHAQDNATFLGPLHINQTGIQSKGKWSASSEIGQIYPAYDMTSMPGKCPKQASSTSNIDLNHK